jgi:hypothetical protein
MKKNVILYFIKRKSSIQNQRYPTTKQNNILYRLSFTLSLPFSLLLFAVSHVQRRSISYNGRPIIFRKHIPLLSRHKIRRTNRIRTSRHHRRSRRSNTVIIRGGNIAVRRSFRSRITSRNMEDLSRVELYQCVSGLSDNIIGLFFSLVFCFLLAAVEFLALLRGSYGFEYRRDFSQESGDFGFGADCDA